MRIDCLVVQVRSETWFAGKKDEREVEILTCLDSDPIEPMPQTFDYRPSADEVKEYPPKSLLMKPLSLAVRDQRPSKGGRLVMIGRIVSNGGAAKPPARS